MGTILRNRRAVSPLIATILLIAFAVALGAVVMNIGRAIQPTGPMEVSCDAKLNLEVVEIAGTKKVCLNDQGAASTIELTIRNGENSEIEDLHISVIGSKDVYNKNGVLLSKILKLEATKLKLAYNKDTFGDVLQITLTPEIKQSGEMVLCKNSQLVLESIAVC